VVVLRPSEDDYEERHPTHADTLVVVEVSDSSLGYDRHVKGQRYAQAAIPEYWLVDLKRDRIFVHLSPIAGEYHRVRTYRVGEEWTSAALGGVIIPVDAVLKSR